MNTIKVRSQFKADKYRPKFHYQSPSQYMGDPNGTFFWNGYYHLFYQYNPDESFDNPKRMHWGHSRSKDLVYWEDLPIALAPESGSPDYNGCFSGGSFEMNGLPALVYYGRDGGICIATSDENLISWEKIPENPVISKDIPKLPVPHWHPWDPSSIWQEGEHWYMLTGGRWDDGRDTAFLFRSENLYQWEYMHPFYEPGYESDCSVPDFFKIDDKYVLNFSSHERGTQYYVGSYSNSIFIREHHGQLTFPTQDMNPEKTSTDILNIESGNLLANNTLLDGKQRRIFFGWVCEGTNESTQRQVGWSGVMTIPRVITLAKDYALNSEPVPEIEKLRGTHYHQSGVTICGETELILPDAIHGNCMEVIIKFERNVAKEFGLSILGSPNHTEKTDIYYEKNSGNLVLDTNNSSLNTSVVGKGIQKAPVRLDESGGLTIRIFVDHSIVEVFANGQTIVKRVYPFNQDATRVTIFSRESSTSISSINCWEMKSIWPELEN